MKKNKIIDYIVKTLNGMAYGFFASLIIGTILKQLGLLTGINELVVWGNVATYLMGAGIGIGVASQINAKGLNLIAAIVAGTIGAGTFQGNSASVGNPLSAYIAVIAAVEITKLIANKTPVDIILVPFVSIVVAGLITKFIGPYISQLITGFGQLINQATTLQPFFMSIVVAVLMGMALTAPISSAAIGIMLGLNGLAAGAALVGCCAQMVGFAAMSIDDNNIGEVIAVGIGTSMLHFENIVRHPQVWLPPIITSALLAPISTVGLGIKCTPIGSGMGTAGLVGIMEAINTMGTGSVLAIILIDVIAPFVLTFLLYKTFLKLGWIKSNYLKIDKI